MKSGRWRHPVVKHWGAMLVALLAATGLASHAGFFWRFDQSFYDAALPTAAPPTDVVIVAVDDASIAELGRWPWRRAVHAALIDRLREAGAKAVALDLLLTEPERDAPQEDIALANAMVRGPPTVLPLAVEMPSRNRPLREQLPIPILAQAAAGIGHAHLELDRDGVARSVFLREGIGAPSRPHFAVALLQSVPGEAPVHLSGARHPDLAGAGNVWVRDYQILIPFLGPAGTFTQLSYVDVLRGSVPAAALRGKWVLVGATAQGIGDAYPTPRSGEGRDMPGVEIAANVLQALRGGNAIRPVPPAASALLSLLPILLAAVALLLLAPKQSLLVVLGLALVALAAALALLRSGGWWWPPSASVAALLVIYPLWSWRRLEATQKFFAREFALLAAEHFPLLSPIPQPTGTQHPIEFVEQRIELLRHAIERLRSVRRLFADTISNLPDATLLVDTTGRIVLANPAAAALFGSPDYRDMEDKSLDSLLHAMVAAENVRFETLAAGAPCTIEATFGATGVQALIRAVAFRDIAQHRIGTIVAIADITELRAVQRERDDVLRFLSHDMKSPASSLLGLAQLQRDPARALPPGELSQRLDLLAQRLLTLVDGFVSLARAESSDPLAFEDFDLRDAVQDAYDEVWAMAQVRGIAISATVPEESVVVHGDRQLLARAIVNLLNNAVKFSPQGGSVRLVCKSVDNRVLVNVVDDGPGIAVENVALLFERFARGLHRGAADPGGAGLGLAFVRVVAAKHGGEVAVHSTQDQGAEFSISLPATPVTAAQG